MYIVLVAHDSAPSEGLAKLQEKLECDAHTVTSFFAFGKRQITPTATIVKHITQADILVTGMSSEPLLAQEEIAAADAAREAKVPFSLYADSFGTFGRPWFTLFRDHAQLLFVVDKQEAREAQKLFPNTRIVPAGNPLWEDFAREPHKRQKERERLAIKDKNHLILIPFGKDLNSNITLFRAIAAAGHKSTNREKIRLFISIHPGDRHNLVLYQSLNQKEMPAIIAPNDTMPCRMLLSAADLVITCASTVGIEAAHLRIPVIDFFTAQSRKRMQDATGRTFWKPCESGASSMVFEDTDALMREIDWLLSEKGVRAMRAAQKKMFPRVCAKGEAVTLMATAIEDIIASPSSPREQS